MNQEELINKVREYADPYVAPSSELAGRIAEGGNLTFGGPSIKVNFEAMTGASDVDLSQFAVTGEIPAVGDAIAAPESTSVERRRYAEAQGCMALIQRKKMIVRDPQASEAIKDANGSDDTEAWVETCISLCDFIATIREENLMHVGDQIEVVYRIDGITSRGISLKPLEVPAPSFADMKWLAEWGADISIKPSWPKSLGSITSNIKEAIVERKKVFPPLKREIYDGLGWEKINGQQVYLHADGGIGEAGLISDLEVDTGLDAFSKHSLPEPPQGEDLLDSIRASLAILDVTKDKGSVPVLLGAYRATLPILAAFGIHIFSKSGAGKSTLMALGQGHWRTDATDKTFNSWTSTVASLEAIIHAGRNCLVCIDDANQDVEGINKKLERIFRSQGNGVARGRMNVLMKSQRSFPPRGLVMSTGEDLPIGLSCRARILLVECPQVVQDLDNSVLDDLQRKVREGYMTRAMAAWLQWLAPKVDEIKSTWDESRILMRKQVNQVRLEQHKRSVDQVCELLTTGNLLLQFATEKGAITQTQMDAYWHRFLVAFESLAEDQQREQMAEDPCQKFLEWIPDLMQAGACHLTDMTGKSPSDLIEARRFGWITGSSLDNRPQGLCIGKLIGDKIYLNKLSTYEVIFEHAKRIGNPTFGASKGMFWRNVQKFLEVPSADGKHIGSRVSQVAQKKLGLESQFVPIIKVTTFPAWADWVPAEPVVPIASSFGGSTPVPFIPGLGKMGGQLDDIDLTLILPASVGRGN